MTKTAKWSMIGVLAALVLALFAVAGCSSGSLDIPILKFSITYLSMNPGEIGRASCRERV